MSDGDQEFRPKVNGDHVTPAITTSANSPREAEQKGLLSRDITKQPTTVLTSMGTVQNNPNIEHPAMPKDTSGQPTMPESPLYPGNPLHAYERYKTQKLNVNNTQKAS